MSLETMTKLTTTTVGVGGVASVTFSNIPQGYTDLKVVASSRSTRSDANDFIKIGFNGLTTNLNHRALNGSGTSVSSGNDGSFIYGTMNAATSTASIFGNAEFYISNYAGNTFKNVNVDTVMENNATFSVTYLAAGLWSNSSPITSINLAPYFGSFVEHTTITLYGVKSANQIAKATGGNSVVYDGTYFVHTYTTSGTFTAKQPLTVEYLVIAGGGGGAAVSSGGNYGAPGGGAGGYRSSIGSESSGGGAVSEAKLPVSTNTLNVLVGAGGAGNVQGTDSIFGNIVSIGGGYAPVGNGGSGGGGFDFSPYLTPGSGTSGQGYAGGAAASATSPGGGGGAGGVGSTARTGGAGVTSSVTGAAVARAGGGGGGWGGTATAGGGNGAAAGASGDGSAGTANTGGGGGGCSAVGSTRSGGAGGSGIVIIRYKG
jgi:hypothetical protein